MKVNLGWLRTPTCWIQIFKMIKQCNLFSSSYLTVFMLNIVCWLPQNKRYKMCFEKKNTLWIETCKIPKSGYRDSTGCFISLLFKVNINLFCSKINKIKLNIYIRSLSTVSIDMTSDGLRFCTVSRLFCIGISILLYYRPHNQPLLFCILPILWCWMSNQLEIFMIFE